MARKGLIESNKRKEKTAALYAGRRKALKKEIANPSLSSKERFALHAKLQAMPRDASPVRVRSRCAKTGRPRGVYRFCALSRTPLREWASSGFLPGIARSSW